MVDSPPAAPDDPSHWQLQLGHSEEGGTERGRRKISSRDQISDPRAGKPDVNHPERHNQMETPDEGIHPTPCKPKRMISEVEQRKQCGQLHHKVEHSGLPCHISMFRESR